MGRFLNKIDCCSVWKDGKIKDVGELICSEAWEYGNMSIEVRKSTRHLLHPCSVAESRQ